MLRDNLYRDDNFNFNPYPGPSGLDNLRRRFKYRPCGREGGMKKLAIKPDMLLLAQRVQKILIEDEGLKDHYISVETVQRFSTGIMIGVQFTHVDQQEGKEKQKDERNSKTI